MIGQNQRYIVISANRPRRLLELLKVEANLATTDALAALVAPWLPVFASRTRVHYQYGVRPHEYDDMLYVEIDTAREPDVRVFEALELLALLGRVDRDAWQRALAHAWDARDVRDIIADHLDGVDFAFEHDHTSTIAVWCERVVLGGVEWTASREYLHARSQLESLLTASNRERPCIRVHVTSALDECQAALVQMAHSAPLQRMRDATTTLRWPPLFRLVHADALLYWRGERLMTNRLFLDAVRLATYGVDEGTLPLGNIHIEKATAPLHVPGLQLLLQTRQSPSPDHSAVSTVLVGGIMNRQTIESVFSALLASKSVDNVVANHDFRFDTAEDRVLFWRWFALAVFSSGPMPQLQFLRLSLLGIDNVDVETFREVLQHPNPMAFATGCLSQTRSNRYASSHRCSVSFHPREGKSSGEPQVTRN